MNDRVLDYSGNAIEIEAFHPCIQPAFRLDDFVNSGLHTFAGQNSNIL
jgi:hypothetical protein